MAAPRSRRRFLALTAGVGSLTLGGCLSNRGDDPVAIIVHNGTSETRHVRVRLFGPSGESIGTVSYAVEPSDSVGGVDTVSGEIGEIAVSAQAQNTVGELPDARIRYSPDGECAGGRPDVVITLHEEGIGFSDDCED